MKGKANNPELRNEKRKQTLLEKYKYRIGEKFGKLTIIDMKIGEHRTEYICKCECGNTTSVNYSDLTSGRTTSCGCIHKNIVSRMMIDKRNHTYGYNWYFVKNGEKVYCDSSYEVMYANYLIRNNIEFEFHTRTFMLTDITRYMPDFYLPNEDKYIETKGSFWKEIRDDKVSVCQEKYNINIEYMDYKDIKSLDNIPYTQSAGIIRAAKRYGDKIEDYIAESKYLEKLDPIEMKRRKNNSKV